MGSTASREAPVPDTPHPGRFDARELQYLTESFRDLAGRHSKKDSIDAGTFRRAFDLPGLVGERLFSVAQGDHEGVEFSNFVGILAVGAFVFPVSFIVWTALKATVGIRAEEEAEVMGLDQSELGMEAYPEFGRGSQTM